MLKLTPPGIPSCLGGGVEQKTATPNPPAIQTLLVGNTECSKHLIPACHGLMSCIASVRCRKFISKHLFKRLKVQCPVRKNDYIHYIDFVRASMPNNTFHMLYD
jgi:hypothetical protein